MRDDSRLGHKVKVSKWSGHHLYRWRASFIDGGRYRQKGFIRKSDAVAFAETREAEANEHGTGSMLTGLERSAVIDARNQIAGLGVDLRAVIAKGLEYFEAASKSINVSDLVAKVISDREAAGQSKRYLADLRHKLDRFISSFGPRPVATISRDEIAAWLQGLGLSPVTRNNFRRVLGVLFNEAIEGGYISDNPAAKTKPAKIIESEIGILTPVQLAALLAAADTRILPAIAVGAFAGLRDSELRRLDWSEIDLAGGYIRVRAAKAKSSRNRLIPITDNLAAWIRPLAKQSGAVWPTNGRALHEAARTEAGIDLWPANALRHSFGSYALAHRKDAAALALEMGHKDTGILFAHYRELVSPSAAAAYWNLKPESAENILAMA